MPGHGRWNAGASQKTCPCKPQPPAPTREEGGVGTATTDMVISTTHATQCSPSSLALVMPAQRRAGAVGSDNATLRRSGNDGTCGISPLRRRMRLATAQGRPASIRGSSKHTSARSVTPLLLRLPKRQIRVRATSAPALPPGAPAAPWPASL